jgi:mycoredoxin-dependent peroxiredoxin
MTVEAGQEAPDFELRNQFGEPVRLSSFRGRKSVVLVFFPTAFTPVCTGELGAIRDMRPALEDDGTAVLGVSCDPQATLKVYAEQEGFRFPLLSDFWPHGALAMRYGVFLAERGIARRGTFVIDRDGVVRWSVVNGPADARRTSDYLDALAAL